MNAPIISCHVIATTHVPHMTVAYPTYTMSCHAHFLFSWLIWHIIIVVYVVEEDDATCAKVGCCLAFFVPLIGCITWLFNFDAPRGSNRKRYTIISPLVHMRMLLNDPLTDDSMTHSLYPNRWSTYACVVAMVVVLIVVLTSTLTTQTGNSNDNNN
jgi:hypothetical protein